MYSDKIYNLNILSEKTFCAPSDLKQRLPLSSTAEETVYRTRRELEDILDRKDPRLFLVVGPCSIHDSESALEYADRLSVLAREVSDTFLIIMRTYFEKPRTTLGWKGFINDPFLDDTYHIEEGMFRSRELLLKIAEKGVGAATEALDPIIPQYLHDLIVWTSIGARTTESQRHREMASGLSTPVGFKNSTDGNIQVAINALTSIAQPHHFLGIDRNGRCALMQTRGNAYGHLVLRGGAHTNYDSVNVALCEKQLAAANLPVNIVIDCSHGNSRKDPALQPLVLENCVTQILEGNRSIVGLMLESHLKFGSQPFPNDPSKLEYGQSITDGCLDWERTDQIIRQAREKLKDALGTRGWGLGAD